LQWVVKEYGHTPVLWTISMPSATIYQEE